jgi:hypothetical protein
MENKKVGILPEMVLQPVTVYMMRRDGHFN